MKRSVYIAGSMEGLSEVERSEYFDYVEQKLSVRDIPTKNPNRRNSLHIDTDKNLRKRIHAADLRDIADCMIVLADIRDSRPGKKWGTVMEIQFAETKHKIVIVVQDVGQRIHPFIESCATEIHTSLDDAIEAIESYFE